MITGSEEESRALMMNAAIRVVADNGIGGFTTKKWAAEAGVAEGSLYYHFKSKNDLLDQTFFYINEEIEEEVRTEPLFSEEEGDSISIGTELWRRFFHYLLEHREHTLYFARYRTSTRFSDEIRAVMHDKYVNLRNKLKEISNGVQVKEDIDWDFLWGYIMDATLCYVLRRNSGMLKDPEGSESQFITMLTRGIFGILK